jgi:hypothetical protein
MKTEGSLPYSQDPAKNPILSQMNPLIICFILLCKSLLDIYFIPAKHNSIFRHYFRHTCAVTCHPRQQTLPAGNSVMLTGIKRMLNPVHTLTSQLLQIYFNSSIPSTTVFARSNAGTVGSNPTQGMAVCLRLFCVCTASGLATG